MDNSGILISVFGILKPTRTQVHILKYWDCRSNDKCINHANVLLLTTFVAGETKVYILSYHTTKLKL